MTSHLAQKTTAFFRTYPLWIATLLLFTTLLRVFEHVGMAIQLPEVNNSATFFCGLLNDLIFTLSIAALLYLPLLLVWCWKPAVSLTIFLLAGGLFILIDAALSRYYLTTKTLLGADLFGYSISDIKMTVASSTSFSATDLIPLLLLALFIFTIRWLRKKSLQLPVTIGVGVLLIGIVCTFQYNAFSAKKETAAGQLSLSKPAYFFTANLSPSIATNANHFNWQDYPLVRKDNSNDALTPYFNLTNEKPNIVFLIVEGLGRDFTGPSAQYGGFMPFPDSLSGQGLYWSNFLSSAGRSFAGLPSILGSLPYGAKGFNDLGQNMPSHQSLISLLKQNGYRTNYFYGGNANFDGQDVFLEKQGIDFILDESKFGAGYNRNFGDKYSWGYADGDLYKRSLEIMAETPKQPLLNVYFTLSTHEPFALPNEAFYSNKVEEQLSHLPSPEQSRFAPHKEVFKSLVYSDESIRNFIAAYAKRTDYSNTIFIITGDHRLIPVEEKNSLSRFHVPLLIYSPLLKQKAVFPALASHLDIVPSLVQMLRHVPGMQLSQQVHWMGKGLDVNKTFSPSYEMPFMRNKNVLDDYISGDKFLSGNDVYQIKENLELEPITNKSILQQLANKLDSFRQLNAYVCQQNKLWKTTDQTPEANSAPAFTATEKKIIDSLSGGHQEADTLFDRARQLAFSGQYEKARLLCRTVLLGSPNYHDVRVLYGRTYAWQKKYNLAVPAFAEVLRRNPAYEDAYQAWIDVEWWADKKDSALLLYQKAITIFPASETLLEKKKKLLAKN